jgi:hypothetical protein
MLMMRMMQQPMSMQGFFPAAFQDRVMSLPSSSARIDLDAPASSQAPGRTKKGTSVSRSRSSSSSSSTRSRRKKYDTSLRSRITGSASILHALPKTRRAQLLEHIDPRLDAALTADLDTESISKILWMLTKVKPNTKIADLRVKRYDQLGSLMRRAAVRVASTPGHTDLLDLIGADLLEVNKGAAGMGWLDEFLKPPKKATTKGATTKPQLHLQVADGQLQLQPPVPASGPGPASGQPVCDSKRQQHHSHTAVQWQLGQYFRHHAIPCSSGLTNNRNSSNSMATTPHHSSLGTRPRQQQQHRRSKSVAGQGVHTCRGHIRGFPAGHHECLHGHVVCLLLDICGH